MDSEIAVLAFAHNGTKHPDAFVLANLGKDRKVRVQVRGAAATAFAAFRTTEDGREKHASVGRFDVRDRAILCPAAGGSATTFLAAE